MTFGEQLFFGLIVLAFLVFGVTLASIASSTNRHMRAKAAEAAKDKGSLPKAA